MPRAPAAAAKSTNVATAPAAEELVRPVEEHMRVDSLRGIEESLKRTRNEFDKTTAPIRDILGKCVGLYFRAMGLTNAMAKPADDEIYTLEVLATAFRRAIASFVLLESGLPTEAHMLLRNYCELSLIAVDITYDKSSLEEWKQTVNDDLTRRDFEDWYFKVSKICTRIKVNEGNHYPEYERRLAIGTDQDERHSILGEWKYISNRSLHAHSRAQIAKYFRTAGSFQLLGLKTEENYRKDFEIYKTLVVSIISLLIGIPKYRELIGKNKNLAARANGFAKDFKEIQQEMVAAGTALPPEGEGRTITNVVA
jgi:hypothetical protein